MAQTFGRHADTLARIVLAAFVVVPFAAAALAAIIVRSPFVTEENRAPHQPVPFSHQHHAGDLGIDCRYCHTSVEHSRFAGMPPTETCMTCHSQIWTNAAMLAPVRDSLANHTPIAWARVHRLPDYVFFDHSVHVANGIGCSTCHGRVDRMPLVRQVAPLTMGWCLDCHRHPEAALRPRDKVFDMAWAPPSDQLAQGRKRLIEYLVHKDHLTECSACHR